MLRDLALLGDSGSDQGHVDLQESNVLADGLRVHRFFDPLEVIHSYREERRGRKGIC